MSDTIVAYLLNKQYYCPMCIEKVPNTYRIPLTHDGLKFFQDSDVSCTLCYTIIFVAPRQMIPCSQPFGLVNPPEVSNV